MGLFSAAWRSLKRGAKSIAGKPLDYSELSEAQRKAHIKGVEKVTKNLKNQNQKLKSELEDYKKKARTGFAKGLAGGTVIGAGGLYGTQKYLDYRKKQERIKAKLLREAIAKGVPVSDLKNLS